MSAYNSENYVARMDSDDISFPERFEKKISYVEANPDVGILGTAGQNFDTNSNVNYLPEIVDAIELLRGVGFSHPNVFSQKLSENNKRYSKFIE